MELTPMRFKDYVWPHNPATYSITYQRKVAVHKVPFGRYCMQDLDLGNRVMRGEGEFAGEGAYDEFRKLAGGFFKKGARQRGAPVWMGADHHFIFLRLGRQPKDDNLKYKFVF